MSGRTVMPMSMEDIVHGGGRVLSCWAESRALGMLLRTQQF